MTTLLDISPAPPRYLPNDPRPSLVGLTRARLAAALSRAGVPEKQRRMRMRQIWHWIYHRGAQSFAEMTDIAKELRQRLDEEFVIGRPEVAAEQVSTDGTRKWLIRFAPDERGQRHVERCGQLTHRCRATCQTGDHLTTSRIRQRSKHLIHCRAHTSHDTESGYLGQYLSE